MEQQILAVHKRCFDQMVSIARNNLARYADTNQLRHYLFDCDDWFDIYGDWLPEGADEFFCGDYHDTELVQNAENKVWLQAAINFGRWEFIKEICDVVANGI